MRERISLLLTELLIVGSFMTPAGAFAQTATTNAGTTTPIHHVVVIFQENISFDHYFGTYPVAKNPTGEPAFTALPNTPAVNGLAGGLLTANPNLNPANGAGLTNPFRLDRSQAATSDQNHNYGPEQTALHGGLVDLYPVTTGVAGSPGSFPGQTFGTTGVTMGYYDGNTVTALWNYAQHYAMSDNSFDTNFGPSTPGAINLISGRPTALSPTPTDPARSRMAAAVPRRISATPIRWATFAPRRPAKSFQMSGTNDRRSAQREGDFLGLLHTGFRPGRDQSERHNRLQAQHDFAVTNTNKADYIPHHEPFQYYKSTANPTHTRPTSVTERRADRCGEIISTTCTIFTTR